MIIPKGTKCHTISSDPLYHIGVTHYISFLPEDIALYRARFPWEVRDREGNTPIYDFVSIPLKDLKIADHDGAKIIFDRIYEKNESFRLQVGMILCMFLDSFSYLTRSLTGNELLVYELLSKVRMGDFKRLYDAFEVSFEVDNYLFMYPYQVYFQALRRKGFDGVLDTADILYNTYNTTAPVVVLNPDRMKIVGMYDL